MIFFQYNRQGTEYRTNTKMIVPEGGYDGDKVGEADGWGVGLQLLTMQNVASSQLHRPSNTSYKLPGPQSVMDTTLPNVEHCAYDLHPPTGRKVGPRSSHTFASLMHPLWAVAIVAMVERRRDAATRKRQGGEDADRRLIANVDAITSEPELPID